MSTPAYRILVRSAEEAVEKYFEAKMPVEMQNLANQVRYDLYNGPIQDDPEWPGFQEAARRLSNWADEELREVWVDEDSACVCEREPEAEADECSECRGTGNNPHLAGDDEDAEEGDCPVCEGTGKEWFEPSPYYHFEVRDVKRIVFGAELAHHV